MPLTEVSLIPKVWVGFPDAIRLRLGKEAGPQRSMLEDGHLLIILHQVPKEDDHDREAALFWRSPEGVWKSTEAGAGPTAILGLLRAYEAKLEALEKAENAAGDAGSYHAVLEELAPLLRSSRGLHRALQQARDLMKSERELINSRDQAAGLERAAELLLQDAQFGLEFIAARQAEAQARDARRMAAAAHRLNVLAALFLPLTALAGILGMNAVPPWLQTQPVFWAVCSMGVLLGIVLAALLRKG